MAGNKKPKKKYVPRQVYNPLVLINNNNGLLTDLEQQKLLTTIHDAMWSFTHGLGEVHHWRTVTEALNMAMVIDEQLYNQTYYFDLDKALEAHHQCGLRSKKFNKFGYSGPELITVNTAIVIHEAQMAQITIKELSNARNEVVNRIRNKNVKYRITSETPKDSEESNQAQDSLCTS